MKRLKIVNKTKFYKTMLTRSKKYGIILIN